MHKPNLPQPLAAAIPNREDMEKRLQALQSELVDLDSRILEDELPPGPTRSPLRAHREETLSRVADLKRLLGLSGKRQHP